VLDCFAVDRLLYGSDWPVVDLAGGHARWLDALDCVLGGADARARAAIFHETAARVYLG
jgi:L-fuconolactonase